MITKECLTNETYLEFREKNEKNIPRNWKKIFCLTPTRGFEPLTKKI